MKIFKPFLVFVLAGVFLPGCGGEPKVEPTRPPEAVEGTTAASAPATAPATMPALEVASWSDLHEIHEIMEANKEAMKSLKNALKATDYPAAMPEASHLLENLIEVERLSAGFAGETPEEFRNLAADAVKAMTTVHTILEDGSEAALAEIPDAMSAVGASCKGCHTIYKKDDD